MMTPSGILGSIHGANTTSRAFQSFVEDSWIASTSKLRGGAVPPDIVDNFNNRSNTLKNVGEIIANLTGPELVEVGVETGLSFLAPGGAGRRVNYLGKVNPNRVGSVRADEANVLFY